MNTHESEVAGDIDQPDKNLIINRIYDLLEQGDRLDPSIRQEFFSGVVRLTEEALANSSGQSR